MVPGLMSHHELGAALGRIGYRLCVELHVAVEEVEGGHVVGSTDVGVWGYGGTIVEAKREFVGALVEMWRLDANPPADYTRDGRYPLLRHCLEPYGSRDFITQPRPVAVLDGIDCLPTRQYNALRCAGVFTWTKVTELSDDELLSLRGVSESGLAAIRQAQQRAVSR